MKAVQFSKSIPRYIAQKVIGGRSRAWNLAASPVQLVELPHPSLPGDDWVRVRPNLCGICGSDLATILAKGSPYLAPITSMPFVLGHEVVGTVAEVGSEVRHWTVGDRVVLHPALGCEVRGIDPRCDACRRGDHALCRNVRRGCISAGIQTGYCRDTGGGWSESLVAHESQLFAVPPHVADEVAVLVEPLACAAHGVLRAGIQPDDTVVIMGCGSIGLLAVAAIRALYEHVSIVAIGKYRHQRDAATLLGATRTLESAGSVAERYAVWAEALDANVIKPELGKPTVLGGADVVFDCVASSESIDDSIRFCRAGGTLVLVGMPGVPRGIDWTPLWFQELTLVASYAYGQEQFRGRQCDTFEIALEIAQSAHEPLRTLVGETFPLERYRDALRAAMSTGRSRSIKTVLRIDP